jgi:16S rRNA (guanine527-N7)-methyltransferase
LNALPPSAGPPSAGPPSIESPSAGSLSAEPLSVGQFQAETGVSRETLDRLVRHAELLCHWQRQINLVAPSTLADLWRRHMLDSAQLLPLLPHGARSLVDLGSGAGFPGLVLALLGVPEVHLIESDARKCAFLRESVRLTGVAGVHIHNSRIERLAGRRFDVVTARALAPVSELLRLAQPFVGQGTVCLFPKGRSVEEELIRAPETRNMGLSLIASRTQSGAAILKLEPWGQS